MALGKPIYCACSIACEDDELVRVDALVRASGIPFMPEFARRFYPTSIRLRELLATKLGRPRLVVGQGRLFGFDRYGQPGPSTQIAPASLLVDPGSYLLDWCRFVFQAEPLTVQGWVGTILPEGESPDADYLTYLLEFEGGAAAQVSTGRYHRAAWGEASRFLPQPGLQVFAERGVAWLGRCPTASSGPTPKGFTRNDFRSSRPSASCSTTIFTDWSGAPRRWRRPGTTRSPSPG